MMMCAVSVMSMMECDGDEWVLVSTTNSMSGFGSLECLAQPSHGH